MAATARRAGRQKSHLLHEDDDRPLPSAAPHHHSARWVKFANHLFVGPTHPPSLSHHSTPSISSSAAADDDEEDEDDWRRQMGARTCATEAAFALLPTTPVVFVHLNLINRRRLAIIFDNITQPKQQQQIAGDLRSKNARRFLLIVSSLVVTRLSSYLGGWEISIDVDPQTMTPTPEGIVHCIMLVPSRGIVEAARPSRSGR